MEDTQNLDEQTRAAASLLALSNDNKRAIDELNLSKERSSARLKAKQSMPAPARGSTTPHKTTKAVGQFNKRWDSRYKALVTFKKEHGHTRVPQNSEYPQLGNWVAIQRSQYKRRQQGLTSTLTQERVDKLNAIDFEWNGKRPVPIGLGQKASNKKRKTGPQDVTWTHLSDKQRNLYEQRWQIGYDALVAYKESHGDAHVTREYETDDGFKLGIWVLKQRNEYSKKQRGIVNAMTDERMEKLNELDFLWVAKRKAKWAEAAEKSQKVPWEEGFEAFVQFKAENNHSRVPKKCETESGLDLGTWVRTQRAEYAKKHRDEHFVITDEQIHKLDSIGFEWYLGANQPKSKKWESKYQALIEYKKQHGHTRVPRYFVTQNGVKLGKWVQWQRSENRKREHGASNCMYPYRLQKLNAVGFVWSLEPNNEDESE